MTREGDRFCAGRPAALAATAAVLAVLAACSSSSSITSRTDAAFDSGGAPRADAHADTSPARSDGGRDGSTRRTDARTDGGGRPDAGQGDARASKTDATDAAASRANGTLGAWESLTTMPLPRANHCSVSAAGYLVVIGGNYLPDSGSAFVDLDAVDVAKLASDGSIGSWSRAGTTPSPVSGCTATASGSTIYLVDGIYDDAGDQGHAFSAELSAAGQLGPWKALGALPSGQDAFSSGAWVASDGAETLYVMDPASTATRALVVSTAPSFGSWTQQAWLPGFLGRPEYAFTGAYLYAIGGYLSDDAGNPAVSVVHGASVAPDGGAIGAAFITSPLPAPITFGCGVAVDDWVFVVGGKSALFASGQVTTLSAEVGLGGQLGAWSPQESLPEGRTDMALTVAGDFLYVTGGGYMGPGVDTVFAARVRF